MRKTNSRTVQKSEERQNQVHPMGTKLNETTKNNAKTDKERQAKKNNTR
jgi:hypothetical protein